MATANRNALLAKVHIAKTQLGLADEDYRDMLEELTGQRSASKLRPAQLLFVLQHFEERGWQSKPKKKSAADTHGKPSGARPGSKGMMAKIEALLAEKARVEGLGYLPWDYAKAILQRQGGPDRFEWAEDEQLRGVIAALYADGKRRGWL